MRAALAAVLATLAPAAATAQFNGINLLWNDCSVGPGLMNQNFACDTDVGAPFTLVISVFVGPAVDGVVGAEGSIVLNVDAPVVPDYWRMDPAGCRSGVLLADADIGVASPPYTCSAPWGQAGTGAATATYHPGTLCGPNWATILWSVAVPAPVTFAAESEHYAIRLKLMRNGTTACAGCATPACVVATRVVLLRPEGDPRGNVTITTPAQSQHVTWQGGGTLSCPLGHGSIDCPVPVRDATWGRIKSMYR